MTNNRYLARLLDGTPKPRLSDGIQHPVRVRRIAPSVRVVR